MIKSSLFKFYLAVLAVFTLAFLSACSSEDRNDNFSLEREIPALRVEFQDSIFVLSWDEPVALLTEPEQFQGYHLWVVLDEDNQEAFIEDEIPSAEDFNYNADSWSSEILRFEPQVAAGESPSWVIPDTLIQQARDQGSVTLVFLAWADFGTDFRVARVPARLYLQDVFPADKVQLEVEHGDRWAKIEWKRPSDLVSRVPNVDNGKIFGYNFKIQFQEGAGSIYDLDSAQLLMDSTTLPLDAQLKPNMQIKTLNNLSPLANVDSTFELYSLKGNHQGMIHLAIVDQGRRGEGDSVFTLYFEGLEDRTGYQVSVMSFDSLGNTIDQQTESFFSPATIEFKTTDTTEPLFNTQQALQLIPSASDPSRRILMWDSASDPSGIASYLITKIDSTERGVDTTLIELFQSQLRDTTIVQGIELHKHYDTLNYFIPQYQVQLRIQAVDSSGYRSQFVDTTLQIAPTHPEYTCPDTLMVALQTSAGQVYCIDQYERSEDPTQAQLQFTVDINASSAQEYCQGLADVVDASGTWEFDLCSETQWEHACEGEAATEALNYGLLENGNFSQAQGKLFSECNVGTLDSNAVQMVDRSLQCVTEDGVYDLSGQYQEWVRTDSSFALKGSSWSAGEGVLQSNLVAMARCQAQSIPVREIPDYVTPATKLIRLTDGTILVETDSLLQDTLIQARIQDTLGESYYNDEVLLFDISREGESLVQNFPVDYNQYRRDSVQFAEVYFNGLDVTLTERLKTVYILGRSTQSAIQFHQGSSISLRCCATLAP